VNTPHSKEDTLSQIDIRLDLIDLLFDTDFQHQPMTWSHLDGRPYTEAEMNMLQTITLPELRAWLHAHALTTEYEKERTDTIPDQDA